MPSVGRSPSLRFLGPWRACLRPIRCRHAKGRLTLRPYLLVEDEELEAVAIESSHAIDIDCFVPKAEIDERYIDSAYYLVPENKVALEAFAVIRDAMRNKNMVALGRVVLSKREHVVMLQPRGKGLLGTALRYPYEIRDESLYFGDIGEIQIPKDMLALAEHILDSKAASFDPSKFHDRYEEAVVTMLNEKKAGCQSPSRRPMPRIVAGTDLMAALRQSIDKAKEDAPKTTVNPPSPAPVAATPKGRRTAKGTPDQRAMLLPIAGAAPAKEAVVKQATQKPGTRKRPDSLALYQRLLELKGTVLGVGACQPGHTEPQEQKVCFSEVQVFDGEAEHLPREMRSRYLERAQVYGRE